MIRSKQVRVPRMLWAWLSKKVFMVLSLPKVPDCLTDTGSIGGQHHFVSVKEACRGERRAWIKTGAGARQGGCQTRWLKPRYWTGGRARVRVGASGFGGRVAGPGERGLCLFCGSSHRPPRWPPGGDDGAWKGLEGGQRKDASKSASVIDSLVAAKGRAAF